MELIFLWEIKDVLINMQLKDIVDILIVSYIFYNLYLLIKETRAEQLMKGILVLLAITRIAEVLELQLLSWLLTHTIQAGMFALLIVFQPELRRILEYLGQTKFLSTSITNSYTNNDNFILELVEGMMSLSRQKIGALIILERKTGINEIIQTGTKIDGELTRQLLINIFIPNTPLHDGAVVVRKNKIAAAGCFLPLTENKFLNQELGTRHRAALGISERSDCISLVVSEETGHISIAQNGKLYKDLKEDTLKSLLKKGLEEEQPKYSFLKKRGEQK
ncbi:TIGR00159 family protein [Filifactor alocis ATCC 35896]|uniref:Diadenylate cyclase n=1 Tax=Filifactor alocis (strain ATCC 35896 / CCUG 47790 / D40 B5) TaxID=546269 RepID=D6GS10_FILAD|nr:diadenylate cyclase CdaA [Filifactor alocis]EFE28451.1 TIGR00159 family protein [Filifactor alocis ATCC 35896]